jgi:lysophospholipase L1-like esterase
MSHPLATLALAGTLLVAPHGGVLPQSEDTSKPIIAVLGSSVAKGWVTSRDARHDLANGWAPRLQRLLEPKGWRIVDASVPGDDTRAVLERIDDDLLALEAHYVIVGLSMSNEGLEREDPEEVFLRYEEGLEEILRVSREGGVQPVVGLCYPNDNFTEEQYATLHRMNLLIQSWPVPSIDFLGPLDDGHGNFVPGYTFDLDHPDDLGHQELFHSVVPSLFDALERGKPAPERSEQEGQTTIAKPGDRAPISFVPGDVIHSFTKVFQLRTTEPGTVAVIECGDTDLLLQIERDARVRIVAGKETLEFEDNLTDGDWHEIVLTHRHLLGHVECWIDGQSVGLLELRLVPRHFVVGGPGGGERGAAPSSADYRDLAIYRTAWTQLEVNAHRSGVLLPASLEVYAPLREPLPVKGACFLNRAQSLAEARYLPGDLPEALARIEERIMATTEEPRWIDPDRIETVELAPDLLARCVGSYQVSPEMTFFVTLEKGRLILSPNGEGKSELHAVSETEFFLRIMGPPRIPVVFLFDEEGKATEMLFDEGAYQARAKRID